MKTILVTGASSGIGLETTKVLASHGHLVIMACRNLQKARQVKEEITQENSKAKLFILQLDLASQNSIRKAVEQIQRPIHGLICNAGLSYEAAPKYTKEGIELTFGVNHLGHFLLTNLLLEKYTDSLKRIAVVSSSLHDPDKGGGPFPPPTISNLEELVHPTKTNPNKIQAGRQRYVNSKLCNILFVKELHRKLEAAGKTDIFVNAYNPGFIPNTGLAQNAASAFTRFSMKYIMPMMRIFIKEIRSPKEAAIDLVHVCLKANVSGEYFDGNKTITSSKQSNDIQLAKALWDISEKYISIKS